MGVQRRGHSFLSFKKKKKQMKWISARTPKKKRKKEKTFLTSASALYKTCVAALNVWNGSPSTPTAGDQLSHSG